MPPTRRGFERTSDPLRQWDVTDVEWQDRQEAARRCVARNAREGGWPRAQIQDVLEMLGLVEPAPPVSEPQPAPENGSAAVSGPKSGPSEASVEQPVEPPSPEELVRRTGDDAWCGRKLHLLIGQNAVRRSDGALECRECRNWRRRRDRAMRRAERLGIPFDEKEWE
jgi:hypothetical protein